MKPVKKKGYKGFLTRHLRPSVHPGEEALEAVLLLLGLAVVCVVQRIRPLLRWSSVLRRSRLNHVET